MPDTIPIHQPVSRSHPHQPGRVPATYSHALAAVLRTSVGIAQTLSARLAGVGGGGELSIGDADLVPNRLGQGVVGVSDAAGEGGDSRHVRLGVRQVQFQAGERV